MTDDQPDVARAFDVLGKRWNAVIVGQLDSGPHRYGTLKRFIPDISDSVLSQRLSELAKIGLIRRTVEPGPPVEVSYALTAAGTALTPILWAIADWAADSLPVNEPTDHIPAATPDTRLDRVDLDDDSDSQLSPPTVSTGTERNHGARVIGFSGPTIE